MQLPDRHYYCVTALLLMHRIAFGATESTATSTRSLSVSTTALSFTTPVNATCPPKTINYLTHRLPQQCFLSSWDGGNATNPTETPGTTAEATDQIPVITSTITQHNTRTSTATTISTLSVSAEPQVVNSAEAQEAHRNSASVAVTSVQSSTTTSDSELESDSPLDDASFLSFEDWRKLNLVKAGQNDPNIGERKQAYKVENRHNPDSLHNVLDSLGDEAEIELDFGAFGRATKPQADSGSSAQDIGKTVTAHIEGEADREKPRPSSKRRTDAGKTCKERANFASFDVGAGVLKTNPQAKNAKSILVENKDSYMLNECSAANKFIIVELGDDILVDTIVLANFEFFSSQFRQFRVSVSDRYPVKLDRWKDLGTYEARNSREVQAFLIENPFIWARYLRIEFLNHYGNEFYCPLSLLRVHGTTMMEEFRIQEEAALGMSDDDDVTEDGREEAGETLVPDAVAAPLQEQESAAKSAADELREAQTAIEGLIRTAEAIAHSHPPEEAASSEAQEPEVLGAESLKSQPTTAWIKPDINTFLSPDEFRPKDICLQSEHLVAISASIRSSSAGISESHEPASRSTTAIISRTSEPPPQSAPASRSMAEPVRNSRYSDRSDLPAAKDNATKSVSVMKASASVIASSISSKIQNSTASYNKATSASASSSGPLPTTQESFYKTVHKRVQLLEANSTLSLKYIEEQSRMLRDAFNKVEKRQLAKTTSFLHTLNSTVLAELHVFRQQYDQIWQSTVIELETQRDQSRRETEAVSARLTLLADEVVFQKRMSIVQSVLLLLCLGLVIFSRGFPGNYLDLPIVQNMVSRSRSMPRFAFDSPIGSPMEPGSSPADGAWLSPKARQYPRDYSPTAGEPASPDYFPDSPYSTASMSEDAGKHDNESMAHIDDHDDPYIGVPDNEKGDRNTDWYDNHSSWQEKIRPIDSSSGFSPEKDVYLNPRTAALLDNTLSVDDKDEEPITKEKHYSNEHDSISEADGQLSGQTSQARLSSIHAINTGDEISDRSMHLPTPPPEKEKPHIGIARKPLPALPSDLS